MLIFFLPWVLSCSILSWWYVSDNIRDGESRRYENESYTKGCKEVAIITVCEYKGISRVKFIEESVYFINPVDRGKLILLVDLLCHRR